MTLGDVVDDLLKWGAETVRVNATQDRMVVITACKKRVVRQRRVELIPGTILEIDRDAVERIKHSFEEMR